MNEGETRASCSLLRSGQEGAGLHEASLCPRLPPLSAAARVIALLHLAAMTLQDPPPSSTSPFVGATARSRRGIEGAGG